MRSPPSDHLQYVPDGHSATAPGATAESWKTTPLFSWKVDNALTAPDDDKGFFSQYGLMGLHLKTFGKGVQADPTTEKDIPENHLVYNNISAPFSTFICGSQGSGKSHTLSCVLENSLSSNPVNNLTSPLSAIIFHYDKFTSSESTQHCEAAWLASKGIPVRVLVSPSNLKAMRKLYDDEFSTLDTPPKVSPLYFKQSQLNVSMMKSLMAVSSEVAIPLYMEASFFGLRQPFLGL
jgi:hypothetical protein